MTYLLIALLWFLLGLYVSHRHIVEPLLDTESGLRKELKQLRQDLEFEEELGVNSVLRSLKTQWETTDFGWYLPPKKPTVVFTPEGKVPKPPPEIAEAMRRVMQQNARRVPHRAHSPVLFILHPEDLLK